LDLVVWPESSVGIDPTLDTDIATMVADAARSVDAPMIVGANLEAGSDQYKVMTLLVSESGEIVDRYQKTHLVPFGEYIPARGLIGGFPMLQQVPRDAVAGADPRNFEVEGTEVATVISFEGDFGPLVRDRIALGARLLVVATNTSTWGRTWASAQHVAMSQVRAAENGVPVVHAALSGISALISDDGRVLADTPLYEEATLVFDVRPADFVTFYARTGEWFPLLCLVIAGSGVIVGARRRTVGTVG
jgi:apolipoprotein N-acyltransferase